MKRSSWRQVWQSGGPVLRRAIPAIAIAMTMVLSAVAGDPRLPGVQHARAANGTTALYIDSVLGEALANGRSFVIDESDAEYVGSFVWSGSEAVEVWFQLGPGPFPSGTWRVELAAAPGEVLSTGTYQNAVRPISRAAGQPGIDVAGMGVGCNTSAGSFTVHEIGFRPDSSQPHGIALELISASFRHICGNDEPLFGELRFHASSGFAAGVVDPISLDFGTQDTGTTSPEGGVTIRSVGSVALTLGTVAVVGDHPTSFLVDLGDCGGAVLPPGTSCVVGVAARPTRPGPLRATLRVGDDTHRGRREVPLAAEGVGAVDVTASVNPSVFYPVQDGYRDELVVEGGRSVPVTVDIKIRAVATEELVRDGEIPRGTGDYRWSWDGIDPGTGEMAAPGPYDVLVTLDDGGRDPTIVEERISLSHAYVTWVTKSVVRSGRQFSHYLKSGDAKISAAASSYPYGVRLLSRRGAASVVYTFPVVWSEIYGWMTFKVQGRSPNGHKAVIAIYNPAMGRFLYLDNYDAARQIGPWYRWWKTGAPGEGRVKTGKVRAAVVVWKGLGGWGNSVFDIRKVKLTYKVGTLHAATVAGESGLERDIARAARAWESPAVSDLADSVLPRLRPYVPPEPEPTADSEPPAEPEPDVALEPTTAPEPMDESETTPTTEPEPTHEPGVASAPPGTDTEAGT